MALVDRDYIAIMKLSMQNHATSLDPRQPPNATREQGREMSWRIIPQELIHPLRTSTDDGL